MEQTPFAIRDTPRGFSLRDPDLFVWEPLCSGLRQAVWYFHIQCCSHSQAASPKIMSNKQHNCCFLSPVHSQVNGGPLSVPIEMHYRHTVKIQHILLLFVAPGSIIIYKYFWIQKKNIYGFASFVSQWVKKPHYIVYDNE